MNKRPNAASTSTNWKDAESQAAKIKAQHGAHAAISYLEDAILTFRNDPHGQGWLEYSIFKYKIESDKEAGAAHLNSLLSSNINFGAKNFAASVVFGFLKSNGRDHEIPPYLHQLEDHCNQMVNSGFRSEDINMHSSRLIGHVAAALPEFNSSQLRLKDRNGSYDRLNFYPSEKLEPRNPRVCNKLTGQICFWRLNSLNPAGIEVRQYQGVSAVSIGKSVIFLDSDGKLLTLLGPVPRYFEDLALKQLANSPGKIMQGTTLSIIDDFDGSNYAHWMLDWMPRLLLGIEGRSKDIGNILCNVTPFQHYHLASLGHLATEKRFIDPSNFGIITFDRLIWVDNVGDNLFHPLYNCSQTLRRKLLQNLRIADIEKRGHDRLIYVPRKHNRCVLNENELIAVLSKRGFEIIDTDHMTLSQQIETFSQARAIVAPHGAALTNLIFCKPGTHLLEMYPRFGGSPSFYKIASSFDIVYSCYVDDMTDPNFKPLITPVTLINDNSFLVDLAFINRWLNTIDN